MISNNPALSIPDNAKGFSVCAMTDRLMDAWCRLIQLMDTPQDIPALAPLYERELLYLVLQGPKILFICLPKLRKTRI